MGIFDDLLYRATKRTFDLAVAGTGLALLSAPLAALAIAIKLDSEGPVFYRGERVGQGGKIFRIFKFRSMRVTTSKGPDTTSATDDRITKVGHIIRNYKLDELSQLINIVLGDMSLVGPRPEVKWCVDLYTEEEKAILTVRPGITDWSSIKFHNEGDIIKASGYADPDQAYLELIRPEKLRLQLKYVREKSLATDLSILFDTFATLLATRVAGKTTELPVTAPASANESSHEGKHVVAQA